MQRISTLFLAVFLSFSATAAQTNRPTATSSARPKTQPVQKSPATKPAATAKAPVVQNKPAAAVRPSAADEKYIDAVMKNFGIAVKSGNLAYPIEVMYTPVLNQMGGKQQLLAVARLTQEQMKAQKVSYVSWAAQKPYTYYNGQTRKYAVIRYEAVFDAAGKKLKVRNSLLGIRESGKPWQFIMGDELNPVFIKQFLPDFPRNVTMPKSQMIQM